MSHWIRHLELATIALLIVTLVQPASARAETPAGGDHLLGACSLLGGPAQIRRGSDPWDWAVRGEEVRAGDRLRTGRLGTARVDFASAGGLRLEPGSEIELQAMLLPTHGSPLPVVAIERGEAVAFVDPGVIGFFFQAGNGPRARIEPRGEAPVRFRLTRREASLAIAVLEGEAAVLASGKERALRPGELVELTGGELGAAARLLGAPEPESPANEERFFCRGLIARLGWRPVANAAGYRVEVARDAGFQSLLLSAETPSTGAPFVARGPGRYFWRVAAHDSAGRIGLSSAPRSLLCEAAPPQDLLEAPADGAELKAAKVAFRWSAVQGATGYRLVISPRPDLSAPEALVVQATATGVEREDLKEGEHWWGVFAEGAEPRPLFLAPRKLVLTRSQAKAPARLRKRGH